MRRPKTNDPKITQAIKDLNSIKDFLNSNKATSSKAISASMDKAWHILDNLSKYRAPIDAHTGNAQPALDISNMFYDLLLLNYDTKVCTIGFLHTEIVQNGGPTNKHDAKIMKSIARLRAKSYPNNTYIQLRKNDSKPFELLNPKIGAKFVGKFARGIKKYVRGSHDLEY